MSNRSTQTELNKPIFLAVLSAIFLTLYTTGEGQQQPVEDRVAELKTSLAASQVKLKQYQWIETTTISVKGEEKAQMQNRCYVGAEGGVSKVPFAAAPAQKKKRGIRGKIVEKKQGEMSDYMLQAVAMVKNYVPPSPNLIQAVQNAGKVSVEILQPSERVRLVFGDYFRPGDELGIEIDLTNNRLLGLTVNTYLDGSQDGVSLDVNMASLEDGTIYAEAIKLNAPARNLEAAISNSGYEKVQN